MFCKTAKTLKHATHYHRESRFVSLPTNQIQARSAEIQNESNATVKRGGKSPPFGIHTIRFASQFVTGLSGSGLQNCAARGFACLKRAMGGAHLGQWKALVDPDFHVT